jgi:hypothetical protein
MNETVPQFIYPPKDENLRKQLEAKLKEYESRKEGKGKAWETMHPELAYHAYASYRDARDKVDVLSAVLAATAENPVNTWKLSEKLHKQYNGALDVGSFSNACGVMLNYLGQTSFPWRDPGTGLPKLETNGA